MSVNTMNYEQSSTLLNALYSQVTGKTSLAPVDTSDFVSVATTTLAAGYDPVLGAITQMADKTIFSNRPYTRKMTGLEVDSRRWGAITRKLQIADNDWQNNAEYTLVDGVSYDMYKVNKPKVLQTNYYGMHTFRRVYTVFRNQLNNAFRGPDEFGEFMSMVAQNNADVIEQTRESQNRLTLINLMTGKYAMNQDIIHLLTEYNTATGLTLTKQTVQQPANYPAFVQWLYARVSNISDMMTNRSEKFQAKFTGYDINHHTPLRDQRAFFNSQYLTEMSSRAIADIYHESILKLNVTEGLSYWQSIDSPFDIENTPVYVDSTGATVTGTAQTMQDVFGVIIDRDAAGITLYDEYASTTPYNSEGGYWNLYFDYTLKWLNDFSEKSVILMLD